MPAQRYRRRAWILVTDTGPLHHVTVIAEVPPPTGVGREHEPYQTGGARRPHAALPVAVERAVMRTNQHRDR